MASWRSTSVMDGLVLLALATFLPSGVTWAQIPVIVESNFTFRVMAANLTDNSQSYENFALRIFQGLKPDVVAIQEFNYLNNTPSNFRSLLDSAFGTNFVYFRESGYSIPNGIISRWPILASGSWDDTVIPDRGFAWARLDLPGTNDLYAVSVHLKASGGSESTRATEAVNLKALITANFPSNAWIVVAGDMNFQTRSTNAEPALATLRSFLSDEPIPADSESGGDADTNQPRNRPYDYVLANFALSSNQAPVRIGSRSFTNGLVFDSRVYTPLAEVTPVQAPDSGLAQHMAVVKDFRVSVWTTNWIEVPAPRLAWQSTNIIRWHSPSGLTYTIEAGITLDAWSNAGTATSMTTNYAFTNSLPGADRRFFRVRYP